MGNPEPDREEFHGPIAEHILANWGNIPIRMRGAILEAVAGQRKGKHPSYLKFAEGIGISVSTDGHVYAKGTGGRFANHATWKQEFDKQCKDPDYMWRSN